MYIVRRVTLFLSKRLVKIDCVRNRHTCIGRVSCWWGFSNSSPLSKRCFVIGVQRVGRFKLVLGVKGCACLRVFRLPVGGRVRTGELPLG